MPLAMLAFVLVGCASLGALRRIPGPADDLVYVGLDGNVYGVKIDGGQPHQITRDLAPSQDQRYFYLWPTISPDGRRLAYMRATIANQDVVDSGIFVANLDGSSMAPIWHSTSNNPVYFAWSPDSKALAMIVTDGVTVSLLLVRSMGATFGQPVSVDIGRELYFAWAPDSRSLLVHTSSDAGASSLTEVDVTRSALATTKLAFVPSAFRSPEWSPSGRYQVISGSPDGDVEKLYLREAATSNLRSLGVFGISAAFEWSPAGDKLAVGAGDPFHLTAGYSTLTVIDPVSNQQTALSRTGTVAFFWSPDGKRLAFLEATPPDSVHWVVVDSDGNNRRDLESFVPDQPYAELIPFFDQFAQSVSVWSTDSQYLVFTGWREAPPDGSNEQSHVFVSRADGSGIVRDITGSTFGYWRRVFPPVAVNR
jgi:TolB protein